MLLVAALIFSALDWNDNHELRRIDRTGAAISVAKAKVPSALVVPDLEQEFLSWYQSRADRAGARNAGPEFTSTDYPVYIVAAQGGGIYAATQALLFLVKMQASCERFAQHLFAISGVSGGSVGAAMFSALAGEYKNDYVDCGPLETSPQPSEAMRASRITAIRLSGEDYLSPLLAAALFPDLVQRFLPFTIPAWSRARALEKALETGWEHIEGRQSSKSGGKNPLALGIAGAWDPKGTRPALLFNTTETGSGRRRLYYAASAGLAPFTRLGVSN